MKKRWVILILLLFLGIVSFLLFVFPGYYYTPESKEVKADTAIIQPGAEGKDAYIVSGAPNTNYNNSDLWVGTGPLGPTGEKLSLAQFDLSSIPVGASITNATLSLYLHYSPPGVNTSEGVYGVTSSWSETGVTWNNQPTTDGSATTTRNVNVGDPVGFYNYNITSLVSAWKSGARTNYGLTIKPTAWGPGMDHKYYSSDHGTASQRPKLTVTYTGGQPPPPPNGDGDGDSDGDGDGDVVPTSLSIEPSEVELELGGEQQFKAIVKDQNNEKIEDNLEIKWEVVVEGIGEIDSSGKFKASDKKGEYDKAIKASHQDLEAFAKVVIKEREENGGGFTIYGEEGRKEEIEAFKKTLINPILGVGAAATVASLALSPFLSLLFNFPLRDGIYFFFTYFFELIGLRQRRRPWGTIYDAKTKRPISGAIVKIIEADTGRVKDTRVTDRWGRFGFLAQEGAYEIVVRKTGYSFPSREIVLTDKRSDGYYSGVYLGGKIKLKKGFIGCNIPLDLMDEEKVPKFYLVVLRIGRILDLLRLPLLVFGSAVALLNLYFFRGVFDYAMVFLYLFFWLFELYNFRKIKPWGEVIDERKTPLSLAVVRFFDLKNSRLMTTKITDGKGRFFVLLSEGKCFYTISKAGFKRFRSKYLKISRLKNPPRIKVRMEKGS